MRWEYQDAAGEWRAYGALSSNVLEEALQDDRADAEIPDTARGWGRVDLYNMQELTAAPLERPVRRLVAPGACFSDCLSA